MDDICPIELPGIDPIRRIGSGGFGEVWLARQTDFDRLVAVKIGHASFTSADDRRRFERECKALGRLSGHPHIVDVHTSGVEGGRPYLVMEYIEAGSLKTVGRIADEATARRVTTHLAQAVDAAHTIGVLHRDLKPDNVFLRRNGDAVLGDFGIARLADAELTAAPGVSATIAFAAPEILNGDPPSPQADIYGIGVTVAAGLIGRSPFVPTDEMSLEAIIGRVLQGTTVDLRPYGMGGEFNELIAATMATDPARRPQSAAELLQALDALPPVGSTTASSAPPTAVDAVARMRPGQPSAASVVPPLDHVAPRSLIERRAGAALVFGSAAALTLIVGLGAYVALTRGGDTGRPDVADPGSTTTLAGGGSSSSTFGSTTQVEVVQTPLVIPFNGPELSSILDIPVDNDGLDPLLGPADSPQFCEVRPDITGLTETLGALYPRDSTVGLGFRQVAIRMNRFATPEQASAFITSHTTIPCDSWESPDFSTEGLTTLTAAVTQPDATFGDETSQVDQVATLPGDIDLFSRTVFVRSGTDVMKIFFVTIDESLINPISVELTARAVNSLGY